MGWGRAALRSRCFGAHCKSQKICEGVDIQYSYGHVLAGVSFVHKAVVFTVL